MKIYGWLIYNGGLKSPKYTALNDLYVQAAKNLGITLELIPNNEIYSSIQHNQTVIQTHKATSKPNFVLFLDKDIRLARQLEKLGYRLFNSSEVIELCDDKMLTFQTLAHASSQDTPHSDAKIVMPKTLFAPLVFKGMGTDEVDFHFIDHIEQELGYPLVIKEAFGSFGAQVYLIHNREELITKQKELQDIPHLYQQFVASSKGRDVRIYVVGDQVVASMYRFSDSDFRANVSNGAAMKPYEPSEAFCQMALAATKKLGADFTGVDLLFGPNEEPILCEVNSNAHIKNIYDCTGIDVAEFIFKHILKVLG